MEDPEVPEEIKEYILGRLQFEFEWRFAMYFHECRWGVPCGPTLDMTSLTHSHELCPSCYALPGVKVICPDPWHLRPTHMEGVNSDGPRGAWLQTTIRRAGFATYILSYRNEQNDTYSRINRIFLG